MMKNTILSPAASEISNIIFRLFSCAMLTLMALLIFGISASQAQITIDDVDLTVSECLFDPLGDGNERFDIEVTASCGGCTLEYSIDRPGDPLHGIWQDSNIISNTSLNIDLLIVVREKNIPATQVTHLQAKIEISDRIFGEFEMTYTLLPESCRTNTKGAISINSLSYPEDVCGNEYEYTFTIENENGDNLFTAVNPTNINLTNLESGYYYFNMDYESRPYEHLIDIGLGDILHYANGSIFASGRNPDLEIEFEISGDLIINGATFEDATCNGGNGKITVDATSKDGLELEYSLDNINFQDSNVLETPAGFFIPYYVKEKVSDISCSEFSVAFISEPAPLSLDPPSITDANCHATDGQISINPVSAGLEYSIDGANFQAGTLFNTTAGDYTITAREVGNPTCFVTQSATITEPDEIILSSTLVDADCHGANGQITIITTGGSSLEFSIDGTNYQASNVFDAGASTYTVTTRETANNACQKSQDITLNQPDEIILTPALVDPTCHGTDGQITLNTTGGSSLEFSIDGTNYQASNIFDAAAGTYTVTTRETANNTCQKSQGITLNEPDEIVITPAVVDANCHGTNGQITINTTGGSSLEFSIDGTNYQAFNVFAAKKGNYTVSARASANTSCFNTQNVVLTEPDEIILTPTQVDANCHGAEGQIILNTTGSSSLEYSIDDISFQTSNVFDAAAGSYTVTARESANNSCFEISNVKIAEPEELFVQFDVINESAVGREDGKISVEIEGGIPEYEIEWLDLDEGGFEIMDLAAGTYLLVVTDARGCELTDEVIVEAGASVISTALHISNAVTPNKDGINDTWRIDGLDQFMAHEIMVFNKRNQVIFSSESYQSDWDGQDVLGGNRTAPGIYFYAIKLLNQDGSQLIKKGSLALKFDASN